MNTLRNGRETAALATPGAARRFLPPPCPLCLAYIPSQPFHARVAVTKFKSSPADGSQAAVPSFEFGTFGTHPLLMVTAFGLLAPLATVAYKTYESLLGISHTDL